MKNDGMTLATNHSKSVDFHELAELLLVLFVNVFFALFDGLVLLRYFPIDSQFYFTRTCLKVFMRLP